MVYYRMVCPKAKDIYTVLEPLYADLRKFNFREMSGQFTTIHIDEAVDMLLRDERFCEVMLPRMQPRHVLVENEVLPGPRVSPLELEATTQEETTAAAGAKEVVKPAETIEPGYAFERDDQPAMGSRRRSRSRSQSSSSSSRSGRSSSSQSRRSTDKYRQSGHHRMNEP